jgi:hypothetical protein
MLDEIRTFFDELRALPFKWPENLSIEDPAGQALLREAHATSELHWRLWKKTLDEVEAKIVDQYEAGADAPAAIDLFDEFMAIVRAKGKPLEVRADEIVLLMIKRSRPPA